MNDTLSDKIMNTDLIRQNVEAFDCINAGDVKDFIRKVKEEMNAITTTDVDYRNIIKRKIDKLAGPKLIEEELKDE